MRLENDLPLQNKGARTSLTFVWACRGTSRDILLVAGVLELSIVTNREELVGKVDWDSKVCK